MNKNVFTHKGNVALEEYVLKGNRISILEGVLYLGVSNPYEAIRRLKKKEDEKKEFRDERDDDNEGLEGSQGGVEKKGAETKEDNSTTSPASDSGTDSESRGSEFDQATNRNQDQPDKTISDEVDIEVKASSEADTDQDLATNLDSNLEKDSNALPDKELEPAPIPPWIK